MARIPQYGGPEVQDERLRLPEADGRVPLAALGGGEAAAEVTQQVQGLAGDVAKDNFRRMAEAKQHAQNQQILEISNQLTAEATKAKTALMQRQGKNALGGREDTLGGYQKFYQELSQGIQDPDVKRVAYAHYSQHVGQLDAFASPFEAGQLRQADNDEILAELKINQESAAADPSPQNIAPLSMGSKVAWADFGKRNGWSDKQIQEKQQEVGSSIHFAALHSLATSGNDIIAKRFFDDNREEFVGNDLINAQKLVESGSYRGQAQRETQRIMAGEMPKGDDFGPPQAPTETEALRKVDKIEDPLLQDMVRSRVKSSFEDIRRVEHEAKRADESDIFDAIEKTPSIDAIPLELLERAKGYGWMSKIERRIKQIKDQTGPKANGERYNELLREAATDADTFVKRNFNAMRDEITDHEVTELTKEAAGIIKGDARTAMKNNSLLTVMQIADDRMKALGVTDKDDIDRAKNALNRDYFQWKSDPANARRAIEPEEAEKMVSQLIGRKRAFWKFWGKELTPVIRSIEDVPDADRDAIRSQLRKAGEVPTEGRIIELYEKGK